MKAAAGQRARSSSDDIGYIVPPLQPIVMPFVLAFLYAACVYLLARNPLIEWTSVAQLKSKGFICAVTLIAPVMLLGKMAYNRWYGIDQSVSDIVHWFVQTRMRPGWGLPFFTPLLTAVLVGTAYNVFKQRMLPSTGYGYDGMLAGMDRSVFGTDPWRLTHALLPSAEATRIIDLLYHPFFFPMTLGIAICTFLPLDSRHRLRHTMAFAMLTIVPTTLVASLVPAVGPCFEAFYHHNQQFVELTDRLAAQQATLMANGYHGLESLGAQAKLQSLLGAPSIADGGGIAALPSMHNALSTLFLCFLLGFSRRWLWLALPYAAVILFGSVHLGWHYAIDGVVGIVLAFLMWRIAGPIADAGLAEQPMRRAIRNGRATIGWVARPIS
ncbi:MAG: phosphatase PAP2 family protein [Sphingomonas sp.]|nr:phosphatase PAP2 family protein [Sphingomonas sp.]